jgi:hypothetical protein
VEVPVDGREGESYYEGAADRTTLGETCSAYEASLKARESSLRARDASLRARAWRAEGFAEAPTSSVAAKAAVENRMMKGLLEKVGWNYCWIVIDN